MMIQIKSLKHLDNVKYVKNKRSGKKWEIWYYDDVEGIVQLMGYDTTKTMSMIISREQFNNNWELIK